MAPTMNRAAIVILSAAKPPEELANAVGVPAHRAWTKGARRGHRSRTVHTLSGIEYTSSVARHEPPAVHLAEVTRLLHHHAAAVRRLRDSLLNEEGNATPLRCWITHQTPDMMTGFDLDSADLAVLAEMGCNLGIEVDVVRREDE